MLVVGVMGIVAFFVKWGYDFYHIRKNISNLGKVGLVSSPDGKKRVPKAIFNIEEFKNIVQNDES